MAEQPLWEQIGSSFVQHYYQMFDNDRSQLGSIYVGLTRLLFVVVGFVTLAMYSKNEGLHVRYIDSLFLHLHTQRDKDFTSAAFQCADVVNIIFCSPKVFSGYR